MKKNIFNLLLLLLVTVFGNKAFGQTPDCFKFRDGKFKISDAKAGGIFIIDRKGGYQVENNEGLKMTLKFKVTWLDDCTYTLKLETILRNENNVPLPTDMILTVKITETTKNSYLQESTSNKYSGVYKSEVVKIQ